MTLQEMKSHTRKHEIKMALRRIKWNTFASFVDKGAAFFLSPLLAYRLLPEQLGLVSLMVIVGFYINSLSDTGLSNIAGREIAKTGDFTLARYTISYRTLILLIIIPLAAVVLSSLHLEEKTFTFVLLMLIASLGTSYNLSWLYLSVDKAHWMVGVNMTKSVLLLLGALFFVKDSRDLNRLAVIFMLAHSVYALVNLYSLRRFSGGIFCSGKQFKEQLTATFKSALTNCALLFLVLIYNSVDTFLLSYLKDLSAVGFYNVGAKIPKTAQEAILILGAGIFPSLARWSEDRQNLEGIVSKMINLFSLLALPPVLLIGLYSEKLTTLLFSTSFHDSWPILYLMTPCIILFFINNTFRMIAIASSHENYAISITSLGLVANITSNILLIPYYRGTGCVIALFISEMLMVITYGIIFKKHLKICISVVKPLSLVLGSYAFLWFSQRIIHLHELAILSGITLLSFVVLFINREWLAGMISNYVLPQKEITTYV